MGNPFRSEINEIPMTQEIDNTSLHVMRVAQKLTHPNSVMHWMQLQLLCRCEGWLRKQSSNRMQWKRRYFMLKKQSDTCQLFYVRSEHDLVPTHVVNTLIC